MSFVNSYKASPKPTLTEEEAFGPDPYDINFVFPVHPESLETERVKLVPFIPRLFARHFWEENQKAPELFRFYPFVWTTWEAFAAYFEAGVRSQEDTVLFAIIDKTRPDGAHPDFGGSFAGILGLYHTSAANLSTEIACVAILPAFQRTHVASNAVGILLRYCLEPTTAIPPGLGLRRVQWCAHTKNVASARLAERMGFKREGVLRWHWVLPTELNPDGNKPGEHDRYPDRYGRNTVLLSHCWDDWESGGKEIVQRNIDRKV